MAEGTKVGTGYVEIKGDFAPLHRQLERLRGTWDAETRGLGDGFTRSLSPGLTSVSRQVRQNTTGLRSFGNEVDRTRQAVDRTRTSIGGFGSDLRRVRDEVKTSAGWRPAGLDGLARDLDRVRASSSRMGSDVKRSTTQARSGFLASLGALRSWSSSTTKARGDALQLERATKALAAATSKHGHDSLEAREAHLRLARAQERVDASSRSLVRSFTGLGSKTTVVNQRFQLLRNALVTLKWPAIITGAGLAAQALSALGAALVAVAAAVGPAIGVLGAVPGALAAAAQGFGVFKLASLGVADALREQLRNQFSVTSGASKAADASRQVESAERSQAEASRRLADAKVAVTDAEDALKVARRDAARGLVDQRRQVVGATRDEERATLDLAEARASLIRLQAGPDDLDLADARSQVAQATRGITDAENDYADALSRSAAVLNDPNASPLEQSRARNELADAEGRVGDSRRSLTRATRELDQFERGPSRRDLAAARLDVRDAEGRLTDAVITRRRATVELQDLEARGVNGSRQVVQAQRDLADAHQGVRDAQLAIADAARGMADAQTGAAGATANLNQEFDRLPRSAQAFVKTLLGLKPRFDELRTVAADGLFPGARVGLLSAMRSFDPVRRTVDVTARTLGGLAAQAGRLVGSRGFGRDIGLIGGRNAVVIRRVGTAAIYGADALRHVIVAAGPLVGWLSRVALGWGRTLRESAKAGRESGRLAGFFDKTRAVLSRLGSIAGNLARAFWGIGRAAAPLGNEILAAIDRASGRLARWTNSLSGQNALRRYFDDSRPAIFEMGRLLADITKSFFRLGSQPGVARLIKQVRTQLLPAVERLLGSLQQTFGPALVSAITSVVELFSQLAGAGGVLASVVKLFDALASGMSWMLRTVPGFRALTFAVIGLGGAFAALRIAAVITGFASLGRTVARVAAAYQGLKAGAAAAQVASTSGIAATGAAQVAASGRLAALFSPTGMLRAAGGRASVSLAGSRLGGLLGSQITAGIGSALGGGKAAGTAVGSAGSAAGAAAGGGLLGGLRGSLIRAIRGGAMLGVGVLLFDEIMKEFDVRSRAKSGDLLTEVGAARERQGFQRFNIMGRLPGGVGDAFRPRNPADSLLPELQRVLSTRSVLSRREIDDIAAKARQLRLTEGARAEMERIISLLRTGSRLRIGVSANVDRTSLVHIGNAFRLLRSGALSNLSDILRVSRRNSRLIAETLGANTAEGRKAASRNMRLTADAVQTAMRRAGVRTDEGMRLIARLIRKADLVSPTREMARDFGREWARGMDSSKEITRRGLRSMLAEARKMPGPMRKVALDTWLSQLEAARKNRRITAREFADLRSRVATEFTGMRTASRDAARNVPKNVANLTNASTDAFGVLTRNTNQALRAFGVRPLQFRFERAREQRRQRGGSIVPGTGSGDTHRTALPAGSFILNRNATAAYGFNSGGMVPVALEPRERVFLPHEVRRVGLGRLQAMNEAVPRFGRPRERHQQGGVAGVPQAIAAINRVDAARFPYVWGGGHSATPAPFTAFDCSGFVSYVLQQAGVQIPTMVSGALANAGMPGPGPITVYANPTHTLMSVNGRFAGTSGTNPGGGAGWITPAPSADYLGRFTVRHFKAVMMELERLRMLGTGPLRDLGQGAIDKVRTAGNRLLRAKAATFEGGGDAGNGGPGISGRVSTFGPPTEGSGGTAAGRSSSDAGLALNLAPGTDSGWNNSTTDGWMSGARSGNPARFMVTIGSHRGVLPAIDKGPAGSTGRAIDVTGAGAYRLGFDPFKFPTDAIGSAVQVAQLGGLIQRFQRGGVSGAAAPTTAVGGPRGRRRASIADLSVSGLIGSIAGWAKRPADRRGQARVRKWVTTLVSEIGVPAEKQAELTKLSGDSDTWADFAQRANALSYDLVYTERTATAWDAQGRPTAWNEPGEAILDSERRPMSYLAEVNGRNEAGWTNARLGALFDLRNKLVNVKDIVVGEQSRVRALIEKTRRHIASITAAIQREERRRARLLEQIARTQRELARARSNLADLRRRRGTTPRALKRAADRVSGLSKRLGELRDDVGDIDVQQRNRSNTRAQLNAVLGQADAGRSTGLLGRQATMASYLPDVLGNGGDGFKGLVTVQGPGGPLGLLPSLPAIGSLGGEIFDARQMLRQLAVRPDPVPAPDSAGTAADDSEKIGLLEDKARFAEQRAAVADAQFRVSRMPPFGGSFATGGIVPGAVGEARTIIAHGGERVLSVADQAGGGVALPPVYIIVEKGAGVDESKIRVVAADEAQKATRRASLVGARGMPGMASMR